MTILKGYLVLVCLFFVFLTIIDLDFMPVARVTHNSKVLIQNVQPKDEEK